MKRFFYALVLLLSPVVVFATSTINGTILYNDGSPAEGTTVNLLQSTSQIATTTADVNGEYTFSSVVAGSYSLQFVYTGVETDTLSYNLIDGTTVTPTWWFSSNSPLVVTINALDDGGLPLDGVGVEITQEGVLFGSGTTSSGTVDITGIPSTGSFLVTGTLTGLQPGTVSFESDTLTGAVEVTLLPNSASIAGTVTIDGSPTEGALVEYLNDDNLIVSTLTDGSGDYTFPDVATGVHNIRFSQAGYQTIYLPISVEAGDALTGVDAALLINPVTTQGIVSSLDTGEAIAGAYAKLYVGNVYLATFTTDIDGSYIFANAPAGDIVVQVSHKGHRTIAKQLTLSPGQIGNKDFALPSTSSTVNGTVTSSGVAIPGANITLLADVSWVESVLTTQDGNYVLKGLTGSPYTLVAKAEGFQTIKKSIVINDTETQTHDFDLLAGPASLTGFVRELSGLAGINNATIDAIQDGHTIATTTSNSDGRYWFRHLPVGEVKFRARVASHQAVSADITFTAGASEVQNFDLPATPNTVIGTIFDAITGLPIPYTFVSLNQLLEPFASGFGGHLGDFSFEGLPSGIFALAGQISGYVTDEGSAFTLSGTGEQSIQNISLYSQDSPPQNVQGNITPNYYGAGVVDIVHIISWEASLSPKVVGYNVYANGELLGVVSSTESLQFSNHNQNKNVSTTYTVKSINSDASLSSAGEVILQ